MELRQHPLMSCAGRRSWPPIWAWIGGEQDQFLHGEVGVFKELRTSESFPDRCYVVIEHEGGLYIGCVLFDEEVFCRQISDFLQHHRGRSIKEIGSLDVGHLSNRNGILRERAISFYPSAFRRTQS